MATEKAYPVQVRNTNTSIAWHYTGEKATKSEIDYYNDSHGWVKGRLVPVPRKVRKSAPEKANLGE